MDNSQKFAMKLLVESGARMLLNLPGDWNSAEIQRLRDLEFFNTIGRKQLYVALKYWLYERPLLGKLLFRKLTRIYLFVPNLCHASCHLLAFTGNYWHISVGQTPQVTDLIKN